MNDKRRQQSHFFLKSDIKKEALKRQRLKNKEDIKDKIDPLYTLSEDSVYFGIYKDIEELIDAIVQSAIDLAISKTAKAIFDDVQKEFEFKTYEKTEFVCLNGNDFKELKKKWLDYVPAEGSVRTS